MFLTKKDALELVQRTVDMTVARAGNHANIYHHAEMIIRQLPRDTQETLKWCTQRLELTPRRAVDDDRVIPYLTEVIGDQASDALNPKTEEMCTV